MVNISSIGAFRYEGIGAALYSITKAGIARMSEVLAVEWARYHINVNAIAPGAFSSEMMDGMMERMGDISSIYAVQLAMQLLAPLSKLMTGSPHDDPPAGVSDNLFRGHRNSQNGWQDRACCRHSLLQTQPVVTVAEEAVVSTNGRRPSCMPVTGQGLGSGSIATVAMATDRCSETRCSISVGQAVLSVCCHQSNDPGQWRHW